MVFDETSAPFYMGSPILYCCTLYKHGCHRYAGYQFSCISQRHYVGLCSDNGSAVRAAA